MKNILLFGAISGAFIIGWPIVATLLGIETAFTEWIGYLIMLVGLSMVFVGVKRFRDVDQGGVIRFGTAFAVGLGISAVAGVVYVLGCELHLAMIDYAFMEQYTESVLAAERAGGATPEALAALESEMAEMAESYKNPVFRMPMTFLEIFPMGLLVSLVAAAVLRYPKGKASSSPVPA